MPERPASTAQPSSTTSRRSRSKAARLPKRSVTERSEGSQPPDQQYHAPEKSLRNANAPSSHRRPRLMPRSHQPSATPQPLPRAPFRRASSAHPHRRRHALLRPRRIQSGPHLRRRRRQTQRRHPPKDTGGVQKLLVDVLKECSRQLDPPQSSAPPQPPPHLRRAFLDGDWEVFAGQYFDNFDVRRHTARAEQIEWKPWWPRWISIDWGFEHPSATYWHAAAPAVNAVSSVGARHAVPEHATSTDAPSTHNRATSGSESHADAQTNDSISPSSFAGHGMPCPATELGTITPLNARRWFAVAFSL